MILYINKMPPKKSTTKKRVNQIGGSHVLNPGMQRGTGVIKDTYNKIKKGAQAVNTYAKKHKIVSGLFGTYIPTVAGALGHPEIAATSKKIGDAAEQFGYGPGKRKRAPKKTALKQEQTFNFLNMDKIKKAAK